MESILRAEDGEETMLRTLALRQAVEALPEKERTIIALRYFRAYTQQECAAVVHISQVQVSRLEKGALSQIKNQEG